MVKERNKNVKNNEKKLMTKNISLRIAERASSKNKARNAKNLAAFLCLRPDIEEAIKDAWPGKTIWETLFEEEKITFSYQAFRGYVNRIIYQKNNETSEKNEKIPNKPIESKAITPKIMLRS